MSDSDISKLKAPKEKKDHSKTVLIILMIVFFLGTVSGWFKYFECNDLKDETVVQVQTVEDEKDQLQREYEELLKEYDYLIAENGEIKEQLSSEQSRVEEILEELKNTKSSNRYRIKELKEELETLRSIMKGFVRQIDSLNTINQELTAENVRVITENQEYKDLTNRLNDEKDELTETVELAKVVKAKSISATPINSNGKPKDKIKKVDKIKVCFTLTENDIVDKGSRFVFIRIARPDELVLATSEDDLFSYGDSKIIFSSKRMVDYQGEDTQLCVYWKKQQELIPGTYHVDIFMDGNMIGSTSFTLK